MISLRTILHTRQEDPSLKGFIQDISSQLRHNTLDDFVQAILSYCQNDNSVFSDLTVDREMFAVKAREFHLRTGTLTDSVKANLARLASGDKIILFAHQPNLFMSLKVAASFFLMHSITDKLKEDFDFTVVPIYLIVDQDDATDRRFRVAHFPDFRRKNGTLYLSGIQGSLRKSQQMWQVEKPPEETLESWITQLRHSVHQMASVTRSYLGKEKFALLQGTIHENLAKLEILVRTAYSDSSSLAELGAMFLSKLVNGVWGNGTLFVQAHSLQGYLFPAISWILERQKHISEAISIASLGIEEAGFKTGFLRAHDNDTQIWFNCEVCSSRATLRVKDNGFFVADNQNTENCHQFHFKSREELLSVKHKLAPKVVADNLLDIIALTKAGGIGYIGQIEHVLISNYVATRVGLQPPPQILFSPKYINPGLVELYYYIQARGGVEISRGAYQAVNDSVNGNSSIIYYLITQDFNEFFRGWTASFLKGHPPNGIHFSTFNPAFLEKQEQNELYNVTLNAV